MYYCSVEWYDGSFRHYIFDSAEQRQEVVYDWDDHALVRYFTFEYIEGVVYEHY